MNGLRKRVFVDSVGADISIKQNHLICSLKDETKEICLDDIEALLISETGTKISIAALNRCLDSGVIVITLDEKHKPHSQALLVNGNQKANDSLLKQISWKEKRKTQLIKEILSNKYSCCQNCLDKNSVDTKLDIDMPYSDIEMMEGNLARIYFRSLFGLHFTRDLECDINRKLNYGYSIIVSYITNIIVSHGYSAALGIYHHSKTNNYNLSYDLFEPFRPIVDNYVKQTINDEFDFKYKTKLLSLLDSEVIIGDNKYQLRDGLELYLNNCINYMNRNDVDYLRMSF